MPALAFTALCVPRFVWAYRGRRAAVVYATLRLQPLSPDRVIVWTDRGGDRLRYFDSDAAAVEELARMQWALVGVGWAPVAQIDTGHGFVMVNRDHDE